MEGVVDGLGGKVKGFLGVGYSYPSQGTLQVTPGSSGSYSAGLSGQSGNSLQVTPGISSVLISTFSSQILEQGGSSVVVVMVVVVGMGVVDVFGGTVRGFSGVG